MNDLKPYFFNHMDEHFSVPLGGQKGIAVAVSGGPDSLALMDLLAGWTSGKGMSLHVVTVDHGLRPEAAAEAKKVASICKSYKGITHKTLKWEHEGGVKTRLQESARDARYALISGYMKKHKIKYLFLGHHRDDQAETFLFRLAKGSGLKGLCGMQGIQEIESGIILCRPLLDISKADLIKYCEDQNLKFCNDPSNENESFARIRLRQSMDVLEKEGLSSKRLGLTAKRLGRAEKALDKIAGEAFLSAKIKTETGEIVLDLEFLKNAPEEISFRVILMAMDELDDKSSAYAPRMEKAEALFEDLMKPKPFRKRTLGGIIFERKVKDGQKAIVLTRER